MSREFLDGNRTLAADDAAVFGKLIESEERHREILD